jgi:hypothetical protein
VDELAREHDGCSSRIRKRKRKSGGERAQEAGDDRRATRRSGKESRDEMKGERMSTDKYSVKMNG